MMQELIFRTQNHLNSYARQGLRVLVMARRTLSDVEYNDWLRKHGEATLMIENRERRLRESYSRLETNLTLLGECGKQLKYLTLWFCSNVFCHEIGSVITHVEFGKIFSYLDHSVINNSM
jgi:hypothetical protein